MSSADLSVKVLIVGGGPAGLAACLTLASFGIPVAIVERSAYEHWRIGETLAPAANDILTRLGVWERFMDLKSIPSQSIRSAWGEFNLEECYFLFGSYNLGWHVDRRRFDAMLALCAEERGAVLLRRARVVDLEGSPSLWRCKVLTPQGTRTIEAQIAVDASGRSCALARSQGCTPMIYDRLIGIAGIMEPRSASTSVVPALVMEATEDGWWYSIPLSGGAMLAVFMTDVDILKSIDARPNAFWTLMLERAAHTMARLSDFHPPRNVHVRLANTSVLTKPVGQGWVAVGDAAASYDPLSGQGLTKALVSGWCAAQAIKNYWDGDREALDAYSQSNRLEFWHYMKLRRAYYVLERRWPSSWFWQRRQHIDPDLVSIDLDPHAMLQTTVTEPSVSSLIDLEGVVPLGSLAQIRQLCEAPALAHVVVSEFQRIGFDLPDRHVIVALQALLQCGLLRRFA